MLVRTTIAFSCAQNISSCLNREEAEARRKNEKRKRQVNDNKFKRQENGRKKPKSNRGQEKNAHDYPRGEEGRVPRPFPFRNIPWEPTLRRPFVDLATFAAHSCCPSAGFGRSRALRRPKRTPREFQNAPKATSSSPKQPKMPNNDPKVASSAGMRARVFKRAINDRVQNNSGQGKKSDGEIISAQL